MAEDWIRFHRAILLGEKRGLPRATRFVYLELALHSRPLGGVVELPPPMTTLDAVADLIGGDRREIKAAIDALTRGESPMVRAERSKDRHTLTVVEFSKWNPRAPISTERVKRFREKQRNGSGGVDDGAN